MVCLNPAGNKDKDTEQVTNKQAEMKLSVRVDITEKAPAMYIKNTNDFDWKNCVVKLNSSFERKMDEIYSEKSEFWTVTQSKTMGHRIALVWFTNSSGQTFQVPQYVPKQVLVSCKEPQQGYCVGKFNF